MGKVDFFVVRCGQGTCFRLAQFREQYLAHYSGEGSTRVELSPETHPMERAVLGNHPMLSGLASVCTIVQTRNVELRPDLLTYRFTCGIVIQIWAVRILNFDIG